MLFSTVAATRVGWRAHKRLGVPREIAFYIAFAARKYRIPYAIAYGLFEQESNYRVIYGHDVGGLLPGLSVTKKNYQGYFRPKVVKGQGRGANGVGLGQITYWTYIQRWPGLWKPRVQVYRSLEILRALIDSAKGDQIRALGAYNGGPSNPNYAYASQVLGKAAAIRPKLRR